jgi:hypothetical protein
MSSRRCDLWQDKKSTEGNEGSEGLVFEAQIGSKCLTISERDGIDSPGLEKAMRERIALLKHWRAK